MPELPDVTVYVESLERFIVKQTIQAVSVRSPFLVRTFEPAVDDAVGKSVLGVRRIGKRILWELDDNLYFVIHLMVTGRFHWKKPETRPTRKVDLAAFNFTNGTLLLTEAGKKKRASLHVIRGINGLAEFDRGGLDVMTCSEQEFAERLTSENHTLKRSLTDPTLFDGIGNAYSDEILHTARLSPLKWTSRLTGEEISRLFLCTQSTLQAWIDRLRDQTGNKFPEKVTAFRPEMAVHGRFDQPCPDCGNPVQRIVYADNETNYCAACQTDGKVLADRSLSRLLKDDWPKSIDELSEA